MPLRMVVLASLLLSGLAACTGQRLADISGFAETKFSENAPNSLLHSIAVGAVSGGDFVIVQGGITDDDFRTVMTSMLRRNALLAEPASARWQLDCTLDFDKPLTLVGDQMVTTKIRYVLREKEGGVAVFDTVAEAAETRKGSGVVPLLSYGAFATAGVGTAQRQAALDDAVRENLNWFVTRLWDWSQSRQ